MGNEVEAKQKLSDCANVIPPTFALCSGLQNQKLYLLWQIQKIDASKDTLERRVSDRNQRLSDITAAQDALFAEPTTTTTAAVDSDASKSDGDDEEFPLLLIIISAVVVILLCAIIIVLATRGGGKQAAAAAAVDSNVVAFENPMYDDPGQNQYDAGYGGAAAAAPAAAGGLYDEPAFNETEPEAAAEPVGG